MNPLNGLHENRPAFRSIRVVRIHVLEQLPCVVLHYPEYMQQPLVTFGVDIQGCCPEFGQGPADKMG